MRPNSLTPLAVSTSACKPDLVQIRVGPLLCRAAGGTAAGLAPLAARLAVWRPLHADR